MGTETAIGGVALLINVFFWWGLTAIPLIIIWNIIVYGEDEE